jgi:hypothetical protein
MNHKKFVFVTGAPGSSWSTASHKLKKQFAGFDRSDETEERLYALPDEYRNQYNVARINAHIGSYFGPQHEFGHHFDNLDFYNNNVEEFYNECSKPFSNEEKEFKLVKSHWFAYNLDWIWENCKNHFIMLVWREPSFSRDWWYQLGGWDIKHPVYTWYENDERMWNQIQQETNLIWEFGQKHKVEWFDLDNGNWIEKRFGKKLKEEPIVPSKFTDTIKIAYFKIL